MGCRRILQSSGGAQDVAEVHLRARQLGVEGRCVLEGFDGGGDQAPVAEHAAELIVRRRHIRLEFDGLAECRFGWTEIAPGGQQVAEIVPGTGRRVRQFGRCLERRFGFLVASQPPQGVAEVEPRRAVGRIVRQDRPIGFASRRELPLLMQGEGRFECRILVVAGFVHAGKFIPAAGLVAQRCEAAEAV